MRNIGIPLSKTHMSPLLPSQIPLNNDERVFFITVGILGVCFYSAVVGQMSVLVANMNTVGLRHT